jgi:hypothetical protein
VAEQFRGELEQGIAENVMVFIKDSSDHRTGKTSLTFTITASKNGAAFASITPAVTERGNGWYNLALTGTHTNTAGALALHITAAGADPEDLEYRVKDRPTATWLSATRSLTDTAGFQLHADYDAAKSAASAASVTALGSPMQAGGAVELAASQPSYAPAKAGDAMTLTAAYDAAKAAAAAAALTDLHGDLAAVAALVAALPASAAIVADLLDHLLAGHGTAGTVGKALSDAAAPGGDAALLKLIANVCARLIGCQGWDGAQTSPLTLAFSGSISAGTMTLYAAPAGDLSAKSALGTWNGSTFTKDAGWTGQIAKGKVLYFETDANWANTAGTVTMTVKTAFLASLSIAWNLPAVSGASKGWPTVDGGIQYEEGGTWKMLPAAVAGSGTIWDALTADHQLANSFGAWVSNLAREATLLAQLVTGVVQNRVLVNPGGAPVELYTENVKLLTFNLGSDHALTGRRLFIAVKADAAAANETAIILAECTITDASNGVATYTTTKTETATAGAYKFDLTSTDSDGSSNPRTEAAGDFTILQGVRRN